MTDRSGLVLAKMAALLAAVLCLSVYPLLLTAVDFDAALLEQPAAMIDMAAETISALMRTSSKTVPTAGTSATGWSMRPRCSRLVPFLMSS